MCKTKRLQVKHKASSQPVSPGACPSDSDVVIVAPLKPHYKLLQFHTNHRPAYFGTWRKRSEVITPRNPFKKDEVTCGRVERCQTLCFVVVKPTTIAMSLRCKITHLSETCTLSACGMLTWHNMLVIDQSSVSCIHSQ